MTEELMINKEAYLGDQEDYDAIKEAIGRLSSASQEQFETIKKEKWYNRVFDMVTCSQKGKKRIAEQVGTIAEAQQILLELLLRLSANDANISEIVTQSMDDIKRIQEQNIYLLERIKKLENVSLGIKPDTDIRRLPENAKEILSACLYAVSERNETPSDFQKKYANTILKFLDCDSQMEHPTNALDSMKNETKRMILNVCMEYIFLGDCTSETYDMYEDFIGEFDFGNKTINSIKNQINQLYKLRSAEGFLTKYGLDDYDNISDIFEFEFEEEDDSDVEESIEDVDFEECEDEYITDMLQIQAGEKKVYKNKNIHINTYINCEGNLVFDHCVLYYNESDAGDEIQIAQGGGLVIRNSIITCMGVDENIFITCEKENDILIENTTLIDCSYFIEATSYNSFIIRGCTIKNCFKKLITLCSFSNDEEKVCEIVDNAIEQKELKSFYVQYNEKRSNFWAAVIEADSKTMKFERNEVIIYPQFSWSVNIYKNVRGTINNCKFKGTKRQLMINTVNDCYFELCTNVMVVSGKVSNSIFDKCTNVIHALDKTIIKNCQFLSCKDQLIVTTGGASGLKIEWCQFRNIKNMQESGSQTEINACIKFSGNGDGFQKKDLEMNYIGNCIFDGVEMENNFLIAAVADEKPICTIAKVEKCDFRNCSTQRSSGKIIKEYTQYTKTLKKEIHDFHAIMVVDCHGMDKVQKVGETSTVRVVDAKKTTKMLKKMGAGLMVGTIIPPLGVKIALDALEDKGEIHKE